MGYWVPLYRLFRVWLNGTRTLHRDRVQKTMFSCISQCFLLVVLGSAPLTLRASHEPITPSLSYEGRPPLKSQERHFRELHMQPYRVSRLIPVVSLATCLYGETLLLSVGMCDPLLSWIPFLMSHCFQSALRTWQCSPHCRRVFHELAAPGQIMWVLLSI